MNAARYLFAIATLMILVPLTSTTSAEVLYVEAGVSSDESCASRTAPCATISDAVRLASDGDEIQIAAGTYSEHVTISQKDLTLVGQGRKLTILESPGDLSTRGVTVCGGSVTIRALSIKSFWSGVYVPSYCPSEPATQVNVRNCRLENDSYDVNVKMGDATISHSRLAGTHGLYVGQDSGPVTVLVANSTFSNVNSGVWHNSPVGSLRIRDNEFRGCSTGIRAWGEGTLKANRNLIVDTYYGISVKVGAPVITNNVIDGGRYGISLTGSESLVAHNTIVNTSGMGIRCHTDSWRDYSWVVNNALLDNEYGFYGETGCQADVQTNAAYGSVSSNYDGSFQDHGDNLDGFAFRLGDEYAAEAVYESVSPYIIAVCSLDGAGTSDESLPKKDHYGNKRGTSPTIGAVE